MTSTCLELETQQQPMVTLQLLVLSNHMSINHYNTKQNEEEMLIL